SAARTRARRPPDGRPRTPPQSRWGTPGRARARAARTSRAAGDRSSSACRLSSRTQTAAASNPGRFSVLAGSVVAVSVVGGGEVGVVQGGGESLTGQGVLGAYDRGFPSAAGRLLVWCGRAAWATGTGCSIGW